MMHRLRAVKWARFLTLFLAPNLIFACVAYITDAPALIGLLNIVVLALAIGVCIAFVQPVFEVLFTDRLMDRADWLCMGIMAAWFSIVLNRGWSIVWRWFGQPIGFADTDFTSYTVFMMACAGVFHLAAPGTVKERVPPERWLRIGIGVAIAVFLAILAGYLMDSGPFRDFRVP